MLLGVSNCCFFCAFYFRMPPKSKRKRSVPPRYRDDTVDSSAATRQRTASDASVPVPQASTSSVPAPQASTSSVPVSQASPSSVPAPQASTSSVVLLTTQLTALQHQMEAMQDVVLGLASSIHSPPLVTPVFVDPAETSVTQPHAEPTITSAFDHHVSVGATLDSVGPSAQQNVSGEQQTFALPGNSSSFSSVPLGALVDAKLKAKIWSRQYVDLALLTGDSSTRYSVVLDAGAESSSWRLKEEPLKKIDTIGSWTDAFLIYMAIYVDRYPTEVSQLLKYMQLVRGMASSRNNIMFLHYDRHFRKLRAANAMNWDVLHHELYLSLSFHNRPFSGGVPASGPKQNGGMPKGFCYAYGTTGRCGRAGCPFKHECAKCRAKHPTSRCFRGAGAQPSPNPNQRRRSQPPPKAQ